MEFAGAALLAILGVAVASFLNVCIDRLPYNESLISPASHCASCRHPLAIKDLIPVVSYLWLRGRCRYCQAAIKRRLLWVEIGTGVLFAVLYWHYGLTIELAVAAFYSCLFIVLMVIDLEQGLILNKVVYPAAAVALIFSIFVPLAGVDMLDRSLIDRALLALVGGGVGLGLFLIVALIFRGGMGMGDIKMAALVGLATGFPLVVVALFLAIIFGGLVAVVLLLLKLKQRKQAIPFGPFLSLGAMITLVWGSSLLDWYLHLF